MCSSVGGQLAHHAGSPRLFPQHGIKPGEGAHAYNPSTQKAEAGGSSVYLKRVWVGVKEVWRSGTGL